jgi:hypothetical protein
LRLRLLKPTRAKGTLKMNIATRERVGQGKSVVQFPLLLPPIATRTEDHPARRAKGKLSVGRAVSL